MYYVNCFLVYSILGYLFENILSKLKKTDFDSGILFGPWTPVYGIGVVLVLLLSKFIFQNLHWVKWREIFVVFVIVILALTFIEWLGGMLIEKIFHVTFWNYENFPLHIGKYIAVEVSLGWGLLSLVLIYGIHPFMDVFIRRIPVFISYVFILFIGIDFVLTFVRYKRT